MRIIGTIEARMGSTRLPGKTLTAIYDGMPLLECVVKRFSLCRSVEQVVVATTAAPQDDAIAAWCGSHGVACSRGSEDDVLDRVARAAGEHKADAIVQMGADSAYLDFELIDSLVASFLAGGYDYVCNDLKLTYPLGIYGHVVGVPALSALNARTDISAEDREDVVRYIFEHPDRYRLLNVEADAAHRAPELRLTIDYPQDLALAQEIYRHFGGWKFTTPQILALHQRQPALFEKTKGLIQRSAAHIKKQ